MAPENKYRSLRDLVERFSLSNDAVNLSSFGDFVEVISKIRKLFGRDGVLFRGQENAQWTLQSTLERQHRSSLSLKAYYGKVDLVIEKLESFSDRRWRTSDTRNWQKIFENSDSNQTNSLIWGLPQYELLIYLRHLSIPSPLLDWTASPYVAAFFAFERANIAESRAIYALVERPNSVKSGLVGRTEIYSFGRYATTHKRHYLQQAEYTICAHPDREAGDDWILQPYERIANPHDLYQNVIFKFVLSDDIRSELMAHLYDYNLTAYSLMGSDESLMRSLAYEAFELTP